MEKTMKRLILIFSVLAAIGCGDIDDAPPTWNLGEEERESEVSETVCEGDCCTTTTSRCMAVMCQTCDGDWERVEFECD